MIMSKKPKNNASIAVSLQAVSKRYFVRQEKPTLVEQLLLMRKKKEFLALKKIHLEIKKGERVGIFGPNGSGKTTILKIISGITQPSEGKVNVKGRVVSLIDLEAGFHPDLSGYENIFLNGLIIGMSKKTILKKMNSIISFAGLKAFINAPLFTYSSGMKLRLGFSIAIHSNPDILVVDENINTGDDAFQKKAERKMRALFNSGKTVLLVTHWFEYLQKNCDRIVFLEKGRIVNEKIIR